MVGGPAQVKLMVRYAKDDVRRARVHRQDVHDNIRGNRRAIDIRRHQIVSIVGLDVGNDQRGAGLAGDGNAVGIIPL